MTVVAVIIPYFQREAHVLRRALDSVFAQQLPKEVGVKIVVVDDQSPLPVEQAIGGIDLPEGFEIEVLHQLNGGPGAARNMALASLVPAQVEFVALLDSDDQWRPQHLSSALACLRAKGDGFFFCNHRREGQYDDNFAMLDQPRKWLRPDAEADGADEHGLCARFEKGASTALMIRECPPQTSTVVYRFAPNADLRFIADLRGAGEDHLFFIALSQRNSLVVSRQCNVDCLGGVNIYWSALKWNHPKAVDIQGYKVIQYNYMATDSSILDVDELTIMKRKIWNEGAYSYLFLRSLFKGVIPDLRLTWRIARTYPRAAAMFPIRLVHFLLWGRMVPVH